MHCRSFTILELIIVIAVLAVLMVIALPALFGTRDSARSVSCLANQRDIIAAINQFAVLHDGYAPGAGYDSGTGIGQYISLHSSDPQSGLPRSILVRDEFLTDDSMRCAEAMSRQQVLDRIVFDLAGKHHAYLYRFNICYVGTEPRINAPDLGQYWWEPGGTTRAITRTTARPAFTVISCDYAPALADYADAGGKVVPEADGSLSATPVHARKKRAAAAYLDGHAELAEVRHISWIPSDIDFH